MVKFGMRVRTWDSLPKPNFVKYHLRGYTPFGKIYTKKITNFGDFIGCKPTFSCPLEENFYQKFEIFAIFSHLNPHFYTHNVKILLKKTDGLTNPSKKQIFVKIAQYAGIALPRRWCMLIFGLQLKVLRVHKTQSRLGPEPPMHRSCSKLAR